MIRIFKYPLELTASQSLHLPMHSKVLTVVEQKGTIMLYAMVDSSILRNDIYDVRIVGTGHDAPIVRDYDYAGTVQIVGGNNTEYVFHVFYKRTK